MNHLFEISIYLIAIGVVLTLIGSTAALNWEGGRGEWWGVFLPLGMLIGVAGVACMIARCAVVLWGLVR